MDIIRETVFKMKEILEHNGCGEGDVLLEVYPDAKNCQFEKGACMRASFGGRTADFVTFDPIRARTRISFMYDAPLDTPSTRAAASVIANVVTGFFCLSRILHACDESCHSPCLAELKKKIGDTTVYCIGDIAGIGPQFAGTLVLDPDKADVILVGCEGIIGKDAGDMIERYRKGKKIICIGSSLAGISRLNMVEHWCPHGRSN